MDSIAKEAVNKILGMIPIVGRLIGLVRGGFTYTTRESVVDIGPIHATLTLLAAGR
jgi:hypothetical protein